MRYRLSLVAGPASEPVTTAEAKAHLRVTTSTDDSYIATLITVARQNAEKFTRRAFITQTWIMYMDRFPENWLSRHLWEGVRDGAINQMYEGASIIIPLAPLQSITSIKVYDEDDQSTTMDPTTYQVSAYSGEIAPNGRVTPRNGAVWPLATRFVDGVEVTYVAGYGASAASVPSQIKQGMLTEIGSLYENRGDCSSNEMVSNKLARSLLQPYRILEF